MSEGLISDNNKIDGDNVLNAFKTSACKNDVKDSK